MVREDTNHGGYHDPTTVANVVREDTNHGGCDDPNDGSEMWFMKTRTMAAITIQPRWRNVVREDTNHGCYHDPTTAARCGS